MGFINVGHNYRSRDLCVYHWRNLKRVKKSPSPSHFLISPSPSSCSSPSPSSVSPSLSPPLSLSLVDLPPEILYQIFLYAGPGDSNHLPLTCKYLSHTLRASLWLLHRAVKTGYLVDLNKQYKKQFDNWQRKFEEKFQSLPSIFHETISKYGQIPAVDELYHHPLSVLHINKVIDVRIFSFRFVTLQHIQEIFHTYSGIIADKETIDVQIQLRNRYLEWKYMVFRKYVSLAKEKMADLEFASEEVLDRSEEIFNKSLEYRSVVSFRDSHGLALFSPLLASTNIPEHMFSPMDSSQAWKVLELHKVYSMGFLDPTLFICSVYNSASPEYTQDQIIEVLDLLLLVEPKLPQVLRLLESLELLHDKFLSIPMESRSSNWMSFFEVQLEQVVTDALTVYIQGGGEVNEMIWHYLKQLQIQELVDHVLRVGSIPMDSFMFL